MVKNWPEITGILRLFIGYINISFYVENYRKERTSLWK